MNFSFQNLFLAVFSAFLGSVKGLFVSQVKSLGPIEIFGIRSIGATCFILPIIIFYNYHLFYTKKQNLTLLLRSIIGNVAVCGYYYGFVYLPIAEASLLFYSTPLFTIIIGHFFLKERCGVAGILSTILSVCGVSVVCVPQFSMDPSGSKAIGIAGSLIGACAQAIALALIRKITDIPPFVVSFWWACVGILFSSVLTGAVVKDIRTYECGRESVFLISIAVIGFVSEVSLVSALKSTDAVIVSLALTSEIVWAFLLQYFVSDEIPCNSTLIGGAIIVISLLIHPTVNYFTRKNLQVSD